MTEMLKVTVDRRPPLAVIYTEGYITGSGNIYDGCNVTVDDIVIPPVEGYTGVCNVGSAPCVLQEEVFAGDVSARPVADDGRPGTPTGQK